MDKKGTILFYHYGGRTPLEPLFEGALQLLTGWDVSNYIPGDNYGEEDNICVILAVFDDEGEDPGQEIYQEVRRLFPTTPIVWCDNTDTEQEPCIPTWLQKDRNVRYFFAEVSTPVNANEFQAILRQIIASGDQYLARR